MTGLSNRFRKDEIRTDNPTTEDMLNCSPLPIVDQQIETPLSPRMSLSSLTITEAHAQLRSKKISAVELLKPCIERVEKVDSALNAVVHKNFERALEEAKKMDTKGTFDSPS